MSTQESVKRFRDFLAPKLDRYSLELLDVEIEDEEWDFAYEMESDAAKALGLEIPPSMLLAA